MKSKLTIKSYLTLILLCSTFLLIFEIIPTFFNDPYYDDKVFPKIFVPTIIIFTFLFLFGELRTKIITLIIENNEIKVQRYFGFKNENYRISEIKGWKNSHQPSRLGTYEFLYLYKDEKKIIKISEFHHKNYLDIKKVIEEKIKYLGYEHFSLIDEFKEIFT